MRVIQGIFSSGQEVCPVLQLGLEASHSILQLRRSSVMYLGLLLLLLVMH